MIPVVIVDDQESDRYIVKRRLSKAGDFGKIMEAQDGEVFLDEFFNGHGSNDLEQEEPLLVLMDINMPRMDGFETVEELQRRMEAGRGPNSIVIFMFTSSDNPDDRARAAELHAVKGYILKPFDQDDVDHIRTLYHS